MGAVVPIFPIFFLSVSGFDLLDRQLVSDALHSVNSGDELNDLSVSAVLLALPDRVAMPSSVWVLMQRSLVEN
jgi:hypothetical protein